MTSGATKNNDTEANGESSPDSSFIIHHSSFSTTYPGGKGLLYQRLISLIPPHRVYIAAFAGYDAIARMKRPAAVNIAIDTDREALANLRSAIARSGAAAPAPEIASGAPIVTNGAAFQPGLPGRPTSEMTRLASPVKNGDTAATWRFLHTDALAWLAAYPFRGDEFVYLDPPYLLETRKQKRALYRCEMSGPADHERLLQIALRLSCPVMISGYWSELYADYLSAWFTASFETTTRGGTPATEWIWMNYPAPVALHDYRYLGDGFRERERIKRKKRRWVEKLRKMDILEKQAILAALVEAAAPDLQAEEAGL